MLDPVIEQQAVTRLFELAREGDVDNLEFAQLDALVYERLQLAYPEHPADTTGGGQPAN